MKTTARRFDPPLAIVGMGSLLPGARSLAEYWQNLVAGRDQVTEVPGHYWRVEDFHDPDQKAWGRTYGRRGGFVPRVPFDPAEFGIPPRTLAAIDTVQLLALLVARDTLADCAAWREGKVDPEEVGVILGGGAATEMMTQMMGHVDHPNWRAAMRRSGIPEAKVEEVVAAARSSFAEWTENNFPGALGNVIAGRITNRLGLGGTNCVVDAACASSLAALSMAASELQLGRADLVISGGSDAQNDIYTFMCFSKTPALSPTGDSRPFAKAADGTILGEGAAMVALRRLEDAERDGDRIYAVIRGIGSSSDGRAKSIYAPLARGQALAFRRAYASSGISPAEVELVEAHGTATRANDAAEVESLSAVYREAGTERTGWCALGSVKSQIGHTKMTAGAASLQKAALALHHGVLPPTLKVDVPNPELGLERSPFYLNTETRPWIHPPDSTRKAAVSSLGFGGTNFHVVVEEYRGKAARPSRVRVGESLLLLLGARDRGELDALLADLPARLAERSPGALSAELAGRFDPASPVRLALVLRAGEEVGALVAEARTRVREAETGRLSKPRRMHLGTGAAGPVAFLFPGQGSPYLGMGRELAVAFEEFREVWDRVEAARPGLARVVFPPPSFEAAQREEAMARLVDTRNAQSALGATAMGYLALTARIGLLPAAVAGHSYGELSALAAAGAIPDLAALLRLSQARADAMARVAAAEGESGMTAVFAGADDLEARLAAWGSGVVVANANSPRQAVVAGSLAELDRVEAQLGREGLRYRRLAVSAAFHSRFVAEAEREFAEAVTREELAAPRLAVYSNTTGGRYPEDPAGIASLVGGQLARPVRFQRMVDTMHDDGIRVFLELGPGRALTGLVGECLAGRDHLAVSLDGRPGEGLLGFHDALGTLAAAGVPFRLEGLEGGLLDPALVTDRGMSEAAVWIDGSNLGKPDLTAAPVAGEVGQGLSDSGGGEVPGDPWQRAVAEVQRNLVEAERHYQETLAGTHRAFLEASRSVLASLAGGAPGAAAAAVPGLVPEGPVPAEEPRPQRAPGETQAPVPAAAPAAAAASIQETMLEVVAELTGYPRSAIAMDADLERDLGVDSIKKVELLSVFKERVPGVEIGDPQSLFTARSLGEIVAKVEAAGADREVRGDGGTDPQAAAATSGSTGVEPRGGLVRRVVVAESRAAPCQATPGFEGRSVELVADRRGVAEPLAEQLSAIGWRVGVVDAISGEAEAVVWLRGLDAPDHDPSEGIRSAREAFLSLQAAGPRLRESGGGLVTVQDTGGDFLLSGAAGARAWSGGLPALLKTAAREWPEVMVKAIDLDTRHRLAGELAEDLFTELTQGGRLAEVGLRPGGQRLVPVVRSRDPGPGGRPLAAGTVVLASGGGRGITAACLVALAARSPLRIAILGTTPPGDEDVRGREVAATLEAIRAAGSEARWVACDVAVAAAVAGAVAEVRAVWGPIGVLVHGAGVNLDSPLAEKPVAEFDRVLAVKAGGLAHLLEATRPDPLTRVVGFSSIVAREGNFKQADYAVANELVNKALQGEAQARAGIARVLSLGWGPWDGGMVKAHHKAMFALAGLAPIGLAEGAAAFVAELEAEGADDAVEILLTAPPAVPGGSAA